MVSVEVVAVEGVVMMERTGVMEVVLMGAVD